jgi:hypothetical protein
MLCNGGAGVQPDIAALPLLAQTLMIEAWSPVCSRDDMAQKLGSTMIWERGWMRRVELRKLLSTLDRAVCISRPVGLCGTPQGGFVLSKSMYISSLTGYHPALGRQDRTSTEIDCQLDRFFRTSIIRLVAGPGG